MRERENGRAITRIVRTLYLQFETGNAPVARNIPGECNGRRSRIANDFENFLENHPTINVIIFNGQKAAAFFKKYVHLKKEYKQITLPSTSPANAGKAFQDKLHEWEVIKSLL